MKKIKININSHWRIDKDKTYYVVLSIINDKFEIVKLDRIHDESSNINIVDYPANKKDWQMKTVSASWFKKARFIGELK